MSDTLTFTFSVPNGNSQNNFQIPLQNQVNLNGQSGRGTLTWVPSFGSSYVDNNLNNNPSFTWTNGSGSDQTLVATLEITEPTAYYGRLGGNWGGGAKAYLTSITTNNNATWGCGMNGTNPGLTSLVAFISSCSNVTVVPSECPVTINNIGVAFKDATNFNYDISAWNTGNVTEMAATFQTATSFNQPIGSWDVSNCGDMRSVFLNTDNFTQDISSWDVSNANNMDSMFRYNTNFIGNLQKWNTSNVTNYNSMFDSAPKMITEYTGTSGFGTTPSSSFFNQTPSLLATFSIPSGVGLTLRIPLDSGANYSGNGTATWTTPSGSTTNSITTDDPSYSFTNSTGSTATVTAKIEMTGTGYFGRFGASGWGTGAQYLTSVTTTDNSSWGLGYNGTNPGVTDLTSLVQNCTNVTKVPFGIPSSVTNVSLAFDGISSFNYENITLWDVANIINMNQLFSGTAFDQDITGWNMSNVTNVSGMFKGNSSFNQDISSWTTTSFTLMGELFSFATSFNRDISDWDVSNVVNMDSTFRSATSFLSPHIRFWDTSNVTSFSNMFLDTTQMNTFFSGVSGYGDTPSSSFLGIEFITLNWTNVPYGSIISIPFWNGSNLDSTYDTVQWSSVPDRGSGTIPVTNDVEFNLTILNSDPVNVTATVKIVKGEVSRLGGKGFFGGLYRNGWRQGEYLTSMALSRETSNTTWGLRNVTSLEQGFLECSTLTSVPSVYPVNAINANNLFEEATIFNDDITGWDVSQITSMNGMFKNCTTFNQEIYTWDVSNCEVFDNMFDGASVFNAFIKIWQTKGGTSSPAATFTNMFLNATDMISTYSSSTGFGTTPTATFFNKPTSTETITFQFRFLGSETLSISLPFTDFSGFTSADTVTILGTSYPLADGLTFSITNPNAAPQFIDAVVQVQHGSVATLGGWAGSAADRLTSTSTSNNSTSTNWGFGVDDNGDPALTSLYQGFENCVELISVPTYLPTTVTTLKECFKSSYTFNQSINLWNTSNVTDMESTFEIANSFNADISSWDVGNVTTIQSLFRLTSFDQDISGWDINNVANMEATFSYCPFNQDIGLWNTGNVTTMKRMFDNNSTFVKNIRSWDTSSLISGGSSVMFRYATAMSSVYQHTPGFSTGSTGPYEYFFNQDILILTWTNVPADGRTISVPLSGQSGLVSGIDVIKWDDDARVDIGSTNNYTVPNTGGTVTVTAKITAYQGTTSGLGGTWTNGTYLTSVERVISPGASGFIYTTYYRAWGLNNLTNLSEAFKDCDNLLSVPVELPPSPNHPVTNLSSAFSGCTNFNQDISGWIVSNVSDMAEMFLNASTFQQNISAWSTKNGASVTNMLSGATAMATRFSNVQGFGTTPNRSQFFHTSFNQIVFTWENVPADGRTLSIPLSGGSGLDYADNVVWDSSMNTISDNPSYVVSNSGGTVTVKAGILVYIGSFTTLGGTWTNGEYLTTAAISHYAGADYANWGAPGLTNLSGLFSGCSSLTSVPTYLPAQDSGNVQITTLQNAFLNASSFNGDISLWDLRRVTTLESTFEGASVFNQDISGWTVDNVSTMVSTFKNAVDFDQDIRSWNPISVFNPNYSTMFDGATAMTSTYGSTNGFNDGTNTGTPTRGFFGLQGLILTWSGVPANGSTVRVPIQGGTSLSSSQDLIQWNTDTPIAISNLPTYTTPTTGGTMTVIATITVNSGYFTTFGGWDSGSTGLPQYLSSVVSTVDTVDTNWGLGNNGSNPGLTSLDEAFSFCSTLITVPSYVPVGITNMSWCFRLAYAFNYDISNWDTSKVTHMNEMFRSTSFNQDIGSWDVSNVVKMEYMFKDVTSFNQDISSWSTGSLTDARFMFDGATSFNQPIYSWDVTNVNFAESMFENASSFVTNLRVWNFTNSESARSDMFLGATAMANQFTGTSGYGDTPENAFFSPTILQIQFNSVPTDGTITQLTIPVSSGSNIDTNFDLIKWTDSYQGITNTPTYTVPNLGSGTTTVNVYIALEIGSFGHFGGDWSEGAPYLQVVSVSDDSSSWGLGGVTDMSSMFANCTNTSLTVPQYIPPTATDISSSFLNSSFNKTLINWDVSNVTDLNSMFSGNTFFNSDIQGWNTANVKDMSNMFNGCTSFNNTVFFFETSNVTSMESMFQDCSAFTNNSVVSWDVSSVRNFSKMFQGATTYDNYLRGWDTSNSTSFSNMFLNATDMATRFSAVTGYGSTPTSSFFNQEVLVVRFENLAQHELARIPLSGGSFGDSTYGTDLVIWALYEGNAGNNLQFNNPFIRVTTITAVITVTSSSYTNFGSPNSWSSDSTDTVTRVTCRNSLGSSTTWGVNGLVSLENAFNNLDTLTEVPSNIPSTVQNLKETFANSAIFDFDIGTWNTSNITNMEGIFKDAPMFDQDISSWNVDKISDMQFMFKGAAAFNQDIGIWNTDNVTNMQNMFEDATSFNNGSNTNQIIDWATGNVSNMSNMFHGSGFDRPIDYWDTRNVSTISGMFEDCSFNQIIGFWDVSNVLDMSSVFKDNATFDQNVKLWDTANVTSYNSMFLNATQMSSTYGGDTGYGDTPTIEFFSDNFITFTWSNVPNTSTITIPLTGGSGLTTNDLISWTELQAAGVTNNPSFTNNSGSTKDITAIISVSTGSFTRLGGTWTNGQYLTSVQIRNNNLNTNWALGNITSLEEGFLDCTNLTSVPPYSPPTVTNISYIFKNAVSINCSLEFWDTGNVSTMREAFYRAETFNGDITTWNTINVTDLYATFYGETNPNSFNQDINGWNVSNVTTLEFTFRGATAFNKSLDSWNTASVKNMANTFAFASDFNGLVNGWYTGNVTDMTNMFFDCVSYNQNMVSWNTYNVATMQSMFDGATAFNQNITFWPVPSSTVLTNMFLGSGMVGNTHGLTTPTPLFSQFNFRDPLSPSGIQSAVDLWITDPTAPEFTDITNYPFYGLIQDWNLSQITDMSNLFKDKTTFNDSSILSWDTSTVTNMTSMFEGATSFNRSLNTWNFSNVKITTNMFKNATSFNSSLAKINVSRVTTMSGMFEGATSYNTAIYNWNVSNVRDMSSMFKGAIIYNQPMAIWDVRNVTDFTSMFEGASSFNTWLNDWRTNSAINLTNMFKDATAFNQTLEDWETSSVVNMARMFNDAPKFESFIRRWRTPNVDF